MKISYITNIKISEVSGGMSGINNATYNQLQRFFDISDYNIINPKVSKLESFLSKVQKGLGFKRNYFYFSERRLNKIKKTFRENPDVDAYFFFGFTPWIKIKPNKPYYCYNDASFSNYINIYNNKKEFKEKEINRIFKQEAEWLNNAEKVFFLSHWAAEQTKKNYNISGKNFINIGLGGFVDIPPKDNYKGGFDFLFLSREFIPKGGLVAVGAIKKLLKNYPQISLSIVGEKPPEEIIKTEGVNYLGFFDKSKPEELTRFKKVLSESFALIHPTDKDISPLVIVELAYFGVPTIASNKFAISEYLLDKQTGLLLDNPKDIGELVKKMEFMINNPKEYLTMRKNARKNAIINNTWDNVGEKLKENLKK